MTTSTGIELTRIQSSDSFSRFLTEESHLPNSPNDVGEIFSHGRSVDEAILASIHPPWKRDLFALLEQPTSSSSAFLTHILITSLIVISASVTILETVPASHLVPINVWF